MKIRTIYLNKILDLMKMQGITIKEIATISDVDTKELYNLRANKYTSKEFETKILTSLKLHYTDEFVKVLTVVDNI